MSFLMLVAGTTVCLAIVLDLVACLLLARHEDTPAATPSQWPAVAVLVAARNEETQLSGCLQSLLQLAYPPERLHILVGNDASTDRTLAIAQEWAQQHSQIEVFSIEKTLGLAGGKANVLAQLVHQCPDYVDFFLITDADIRPHPQWIQRMLQAMAPGVGLVSGTTVVRAGSLWANWQQTDWAIALGLAKAFAVLPGLGRTITAIGNNMLIGREAYQATGGYEAIPFSITEDYELMQHVCGKGYKAVHLMDQESSALTEPVKGLEALLHQRKRWMTGAMRLPLAMVLLLFVQALFFPAMLVLLGLTPIFALSALLLKLVVQFLLAKRVLRKLGISSRPAAGFFYWLYSCILNLLLVVFYFLPIKISWKDRTYQNNRS